MNQAVLSNSKETALAERPRFAGPIWTLLLLSPFIAEVLSGSTRTSVLFVYVPEVMVWGVGALLARELVRRWRAGGVSLLSLGLALSIAEEFIIQQTSLAPLAFPGSHPEYGRVWGINLVYFLFMLGFESVWVVVVPVQVTQLFFPDRRESAWLRRRGAVVSCIVFLIGCWIAWYGWTQQALKRMHAAPYHTPAGYFFAGFAAIGLLIGLAYTFRGLARPSPGDQRKTAPAWLGGLVAFVMGAAWFELIGQNFVPKPVQPFWIAVGAGLGWAILALILFVWWSSRPTRREPHRFAVAFGATLACIAMPYFTFASWPLVDQVGKVIFDLVALTGFFLLGRRVTARHSARKEVIQPTE
jgi:hypothetical protein